MKNSRKFAVFLSLTLLLSLLTPMLSHLTGTNESVQAATLKLNKTSATMYLGDTLQLKVSGLKKGYTVTWSSKNKAVATVSSKGIVTALKPNKTTTITATVKYSYRYKYKNTYKTQVVTKKLTCAVDVVYPPLNRKLIVTEQLLGLGQKFELSVIDNLPYEDITYSAENPYIVSVGVKSGVVTALKLGSTKVYADVVSQDGTQSCRLVCDVEVIPQAQARGLNFYRKSVEEFKDFTLQVTNASSVDYVDYVSSDENIVSVAKTGDASTTVKGVNIGTACVTAYIKKEGNVIETKSCLVVVTDYDKDRSLFVMPVLQKGATTQARVNRLYELDKVTYESSDKKIVTIDKDSGLVTAKSDAGTATITATVTFPTGETKTLYTTVTCVP